MRADARAAKIAEARTLLFVPADRPERIAKAKATPADLIIVDLEDAVPPAAKFRARTVIAEHLDGDPRVVVRINGLDTSWFVEDFALCRSKMAGIMFPKAAGGATLTDVAASQPTIALIETAQGLVTASAIAATPGVKRLALGTIDLALDMNLDLPDEAFDGIRLDLTAASRAAALPGPIDGVTTEFAEPEPVRASMARVSKLGFTGKLCIHPKQLASVTEALIPDPANVARALRIVEADVAAGGSAVALDGQMIDRPVVDRARLLLRQAGL